MVDLSGIGSSRPSSLGQALREDSGRGMGMGPRMREDNGWGMGAPLTTLQGRRQSGTGFTPIPRLHEGRL